MTTASRPNAAKPSSKSRILHLLRILHQETDSEQGLTLPEIQQRLSEANIASERKALYRDFDRLQEIGIEVSKLPTRPVSYYLSTRAFDPAQMMLLIDAVQTSRSITASNSEALIDSLKSLVSNREAQTMDARIHVAGRVKMQNESIFLTIDSIQRAIAEGRDISFDYARYGLNKHLQDVDSHDGNKRIKTPLFLVYSDDNYYLLVFDDASPDGLRNYRVDRIKNVMILGKSPASHKAPANFDIANYEKQVLGMYAGKPQPIKLLLPEELLGSLFDMFSIDDTIITTARANKHPKDGRTWVTASIKAVPSPVLFGKIAQFGGNMRVTGSAKVAAAYKEHLEKCLAAQ